MNCIFRNAMLLLFVSDTNNPFADSDWYAPYTSLVPITDHNIFEDFTKVHRGQPFDRVKGEEPPDWNGFLTFSATPDYSDLVDVPKLSRDEVDRFGHQKEDFILQCSYDQKKCDMR